MVMKEVIRKYPDTFVVLTPLIREVETLKPLTYKVLAVCFSADEAIAAESQYESDGIPDVCILPTYKEDMSLMLSSEHVARLFRVLYGLTGVPSEGSIRVLYGAERWLD